MSTAKLICNANMKNTEMNVRGTMYSIDEDGVTRVSENVAKFLLSTPGWTPFTRNRTTDLEKCRQEVIAAEGSMNSARERLLKTTKRLAELEAQIIKDDDDDKKTVEEVVAPLKPVPEAEQRKRQASKPEPTVEAATLDPEPEAGEVATAEIPTARSSKDEMIAFCGKYGINYDEGGTKAEILKVINDSIE